MGESHKPASVRIDQEQIEAIDKMAKSMKGANMKRSGMIRLLIQFALDNYTDSAQQVGGRTVRDELEDLKSQLQEIRDAMKWKTPSNFQQ